MKFVDWSIEDVENPVRVEAAGTVFDLRVVYVLGRIEHRIHDAQLDVTWISVFEDWAGARSVRFRFEGVREFLVWPSVRGSTAKPDTLGVILLSRPRGPEGREHPWARKTSGDPSSANLVFMMLDSRAIEIDAESCRIETGANQRVSGE
jgi:hypothetical protein